MKKTLPRALPARPASPVRSNPARRWLSGVALATAVLVPTALLAPRAKSAGSAVSVQVANTPLSVSTVDSSAHQPFSRRLDLSFSNGSGSGTFTVPAGQHLHLTYVSADATGGLGAHMLCDLAIIENGAEVEAHLSASDQGALVGQEVYAVSCPIDMVADPGSTVTIAFLDSDAAHSGGGIVGIFGYLE